MPPSVTIRPIRPSDAPLLAASHARLSDESIRRRYLVPKPTLSRRDLRYLTEVDGVDHVALVAIAAGRIVGVARFVRSTDDPGSAEIAVVVADDRQGQGIGRALGSALAGAARERDITRFTATMLRENQAAHRLFDSVSAQLTELAHAA